MKSIQLCALLAVTMFAVATADSANAGILDRIFNRGGNDCCCEPAPCCEAPAPCCEAPAPAPCPCEAAPAPCAAPAPVVVEDCGCAEAAPCCEEAPVCCEADPCCDEGRDFGGRIKGMLGGLRDRGGDCCCATSCDCGC